MINEDGKDNIGLVRMIYNLAHAHLHPDIELGIKNKTSLEWYQRSKIHWIKCGFHYMPFRYSIRVSSKK